MVINRIFNFSTLTSLDLRGTYLPNETLVPLLERTLERDIQVDGCVIYRPRIYGDVSQTLSYLRELGVQIVNPEFKTYYSWADTDLRFERFNQAERAIARSFSDLDYSYDYRGIDFLGGGYSGATHFTARGALSRKGGSLFQGASVSGARFAGVDFRQADFSGLEVFDMELVEFESCDLRGVLWPSGYEEGMSAEFRNCISDDPHLIHEREEGVWLPGPNSVAPRGARHFSYGFDLSDSDLSGSNLSYANLGPEFTYSTDDFTYATKARMFQVTNTNFRNCNLEKTCLHGAVINGSDFSLADMTNLEMPLVYNTVERCNFSGANMQRVHFEGRVFYDCVFDGANLKDALYDDRAYPTLKPLLSDEQLRSMHHIDELDQVNKNLAQRASDDDDDDDDDFYHIHFGVRDTQLTSDLPSNYNAYRSYRGDE